MLTLATDIPHARVPTRASFILFLFLPCVQYNSIANLLLVTRECYWWRDDIWFNFTIFRLPYVRDRWRAHILHHTEPFKCLQVSLVSPSQHEYVCVCDVATSNWYSVSDCSKHKLHTNIVVSSIYFHSRSILQNYDNFQHEDLNTKPDRHLVVFVYCVRSTEPICWEFSISCQIKNKQK